MKSIKDGALALGISERRLRTLCAAGRVNGAEQISGAWVLPNALKIEAGKRGPALSFNQKEQGNG